jgi:hypothetical protein
MDELDSMKQIANALESLESEARARVMSWAAAKYDVPIGLHGPKTKKEVAANAFEGSGALIESYDDLAELNAAARPRTDAERALVAAAYHQSKTGERDWSSQTINADLKNLGLRIGNITDALSSNINQKPQLIIQTKKQGAAKQARKLYRVTEAGLKSVQSMLARPAADDV